MALEDNRSGTSARTVRLAGRQSNAPAPDVGQNPDFTGVGAPRVRTTGDRAAYQDGQAANIRRGIDNTRAGRSSTPRAQASASVAHHDRTDMRRDKRLVHDMPQYGHEIGHVSESLRTSRAPHRPQPALRRARIAVLSAVVCACFVMLGSCAFHGTAGIEPKAEFKLIDEPVKPGLSFAFSTPRSQWKAGTMPHIYQIDPAWSELPYAGGTIRKNACGPTSLTMVYVFKTGKRDMTPVDMCALAEAGNYAPTGATEWSFMVNGAASLGLSATQLYKTRDSISQALRAGAPVIASVHPGIFTNVGHYLVLYGIDDADQVHVYDPNSQARSARNWGIVEVLNQIDAAWAYY